MPGGGGSSEKLHVSVIHCTLIVPLSWIKPFLDNWTQPVVIDGKWSHCLSHVSSTLTFTTGTILLLKYINDLLQFNITSQVILFTDNAMHDPYLKEWTTDSHAIQKLSRYSSVVGTMHVTWNSSKCWVLKFIDWRDQCQQFRPSRAMRIREEMPFWKSFTFQSEFKTLPLWTK